MKTSIVPFVSFQTSSAVVRRWMSGFAGFLNCWGMTAFGISRASSSALATRPAHPLRGRRQHQFGAEQRKHLSALDRHRVRHDQNEPIAAGGGDKRQRDSGIARGRLDQHRVGADPARGLQRIDHRDADAVLHAPDRVEELELGKDIRLDPLQLRQTVEPDDRGFTDGIGDRSCRCVRGPRCAPAKARPISVRLPTLSILRGWR